MAPFGILQRATQEVLFDIGLRNSHIKNGPDWSWFRLNFSGFTFASISGRSIVSSGAGVRARRWRTMRRHDALRVVSIVLVGIEMTITAAIVYALLRTR